jgi:hypothetical protein
MGRHGICLLGIIALAMDTSTSMLEQIGYSNIFSILSNLLLGYAYDPYRGLHEVHRRFIPSGDCLPSQRQAHLYNLLWLDDRLCQSGVCVADSDQFLLSLHLSDESLEDTFIDTNACYKFERAPYQCSHEHLGQTLEGNSPTSMDSSTQSLHPAVA